jgi:uncharacterized membrane protein
LVKTTKIKGKQMFKKIFKKLFNSAMQGLFWLLPITAVVFIALWLFENTSLLTNYLFNVLGFDPKKYEVLWTVAGVILVIVILSIIGAIASTRLATAFEKSIRKVPLYSTIKDIIGIFNSSKKDSDNALVVAIKGFTQTGYNIGIMYSTKESIIKDHYTITLFLSPLPSSGFMFEIHKDDIFVIEGAKFNDNLQYIISMGTRSMTEVLKQDPIKDLVSFSEWSNNN